MISVEKAKQVQLALLGTGFTPRFYVKNPIDSQENTYFGMCEYDPIKCYAWGDDGIAFDATLMQSDDYNEHVIKLHLEIEND